jgi:hypothetical protein
MPGTALNTWESSVTSIITWARIKRGCPWVRIASRVSTHGNGTIMIGANTPSPMKNIVLMPRDTTIRGMVMTTTVVDRRHEAVGISGAGRQKRFALGKQKRRDRKVPPLI